MKKYLISIFLKDKLKEYIFIILTATILLIVSFTKSYSDEKVFTIDNVEVVGIVDLNFSREKYINKGLNKSFEMLMSKILLSSDLKKIKDINKNRSKSLINSFQIVDEVYRKNKYFVTFKVNYNETKVKKLLSEKNISFSNPQKISAIFFPILFVDNKMMNLNENFFYNNWNKIQIENEVINFILPLNELDDISNIKKIENNIELLNVDSFVNKYNVKNYSFALMNYKNKKFKIYLKTNFENNNVTKNILYDIENFNDEEKLNFILKDLKNILTDIWKESNLVNLLMPLTINIKFNHDNLTDLDNLKNTLHKVNIVDNFDLEKFSVNNSDFKIYYYGNPKKLKTELFRFGYHLNNDNGYWELKLND